jgi:hypothetical protein
MVQSQPGQIVRENLSQKSPSQTKASGVAQGVGPEFKPQYHKNKTKQNKQLFLSQAPVSHACNPSYLGG